MNDFGSPTKQQRTALFANEAGLSALAESNTPQDSGNESPNRVSSVPVASGVRSIPVPSLQTPREQGAYTDSHGRAPQVERLIVKHFRLIWRFAQRLGLQPADAEDVALRVMCIAANRIADIAEGSERAFLVNTTRFVVAKLRKARERRPETLEDDLSELAAERTDVDEIADQRRALAQLDRILLELPDDLRTIFVLFEIEGFSQSEIGTALGIPQGTVASRIRRARARFTRVATRMKLLARGTV